MEKRLPTLKQLVSAVALPLAILLGALDIMADTIKPEPYEPIVQEGYEWGYYCLKQGWEPPFKEFYYRLQFKGDTIIERQTYKKLYRYFSETLDTTQTRPIALMRESHRQVFTRYPNYIDESEEFRDIQLCLTGSFNKDNLTYDFTAAKGEKFIMANSEYEYDYEYLIRTEVREFSTGPRTVYFSSDYYKDEDFEENEYFITRTVNGVGVLWGSSGPGIMPFPKSMWPTCPCGYEHVLLYKRTLDGTICFMDDRYANLLSGDPTIVLDSAPSPASDKRCDLHIDGYTLHGEGDCMVLNLSGAVIYTGAAEGYRFPTSGIFIVKCGDTVAKFAI